MKKVLIAALILSLVLCLTACGGSNKKDIVGTWHIVDEETATEYGIGIEFTKDGKLRYGLTEDVLLGLTDGEADSDDWADAMEGLELLMNIEYKIKSDTEMEVTISAFMGLGKESTIIPYELNGDTLIFDGGTYSRVK